MADATFHTVLRSEQHAAFKEPSAPNREHGESAAPVRAHAEPSAPVRARTEPSAPRTRAELPVKDRQSGHGDAAAQTPAPTAAALAQPPVQRADLTPETPDHGAGTTALDGREQGAPADGSGAAGASGSRNLAQQADGASVMMLMALPTTGMPANPDAGTTAGLATKSGPSGVTNPAAGLSTADRTTPAIPGPSTGPVHTDLSDAAMAGSTSGLAPSDAAVSAMDGAPAPLSPTDLAARIASDTMTQARIDGAAAHAGSGPTAAPSSSDLATSTMQRTVAPATRSAVEAASNGLNNQATADPAAASASNGSAGRVTADPTATPRPSDRAGRTADSSTASILADLGGRASVTEGAPLPATQAARPGADRTGQTHDPGTDAAINGASGGAAAAAGRPGAGRQGPGNILSAAPRQVPNEQGAGTGVVPPAAASSHHTVPAAFGSGLHGAQNSSTEGAHRGPLMGAARSAQPALAGAGTGTAAGAIGAGMARNEVASGASAARNAGDLPAAPAAQSAATSGDPSQAKAAPAQPTGVLGTALPSSGTPVSRAPEHAGAAARETGTGSAFLSPIAEGIFVRQGALRTTPSSSSFHVILQPQSLGTVSVRVERGEAGLNVTLVPQQAETQVLLDKHLPELVSMLGTTDGRTAQVNVLAPAPKGDSPLVQANVPTSGSGLHGGQSFSTDAGGRQAFDHQGPAPEWAPADISGSSLAGATAPGGLSVRRAPSSRAAVGGTTRIDLQA